MITIIMVGKKIRKRKAPGMDGVPGLLIKAIIDIRPSFFVNIYNICFKVGIFLSLWKTAKLILLKKSEKHLELPFSYRPICLINNVGKTFKRIIKRRT